MTDDRDEQVSDDTMRPRVEDEAARYLRQMANIEGETARDILADLIETEAQRVGLASEILGAEELEKIHRKAEREGYDEHATFIDLVRTLWANGLVEDGVLALDMVLDGEIRVEGDEDDGGD